MSQKQPVARWNDPATAYIEQNRRCQLTPLMSDQSHEVTLKNRPAMNETFDECMKTLIAEFIDSLAGRLTRMENYWVDVEKQTPCPAAMEQLLHEFHKLAGTAGTYGFNEIGQTARDLEDIFQSCIQNRRITAQHRSHIHKRFLELKQLIVKTSRPTALS